MFALLLHESMMPFYQNIGSFPTVVFSFLLALCAVYWMGAVLGIIDIDFLDIDTPDAPTDAAGVAHTPGLLAGLVMQLGFAGVPLTVVLTILSLIGWLLCYFAVHYLLAPVPRGWLHFFAGIPILVVTFVAAVLLTSVFIKPFQRLFKEANRDTTKHVLGQTAVVRTPYVDARLGEASLDDGGAGLILKVRASGDERFERGEKVVLLEYQPQTNTYRVVSEREFSGM